MDFMMPNMDGPTATKMIRESGYKGLIIGVTGTYIFTNINLCLLIFLYSSVLYFHPSFLFPAMFLFFLPFFFSFFLLFLPSFFPFFRPFFRPSFRPSFFILFAQIFLRSFLLSFLSSFLSSSLSSFLPSFLYFSICYISLRFIKGNALPSDVEHFLAHGANKVLIKPLNIDSLKTELAILY